MNVYGGFVGPVEAERRPAGAVGIDGLEGVWCLGSPTAARGAAARGEVVLIIGVCAASDGELNILAHRASGGLVGDDIVTKWAGTYTVVHLAASRVRVWTDLAGFCPVYVMTGDGGVYWATSSRVLAGQAGNAVDLEWVTAAISAPGDSHLPAGRSAFSNVERVAPGCRLELTCSVEPDFESVWTPGQSHPRAGWDLSDDLWRAVSTAIQDAVTPTTDLSGGYDSTAVALTAADWLSPQRQITAVTLHPDGVWGGGDLSYAREAGRYPGIRHHLLGLTAAQLPYSQLTVPATDEPAPSTAGYAHFATQLDWLRDAVGSDCHLTGDGGDALLSTPPVMIAELLARRRYRRAVREAARWARLRREPVAPLLRAAWLTSRQSPALAYRRYWRLLANGSRDHASYPELSLAPDPWLPQWASAEARDRLIRLAQIQANTLEDHHPDELTEQMIAATLGVVGRSALADAQIAAHHGVALHNPFLDSRLIDRYLSIGIDRRPGPAEYKPLLREAMASKFPTALLNRRTKGSFTTDSYQGMRANLPALLEMADGRLAALGLVDAAALRHAIRLMAAGVPSAMSAFEPVIATEAWLRTIDSTPPIQWEPVLVAGGIHARR